MKTSKTKVLYYVGEGYYTKSGSMLGVLYTKTGYRYDWGKVQVMLREGTPVTIKPATKSIIKMMDKALKKLNSDTLVKI